MAKVTGYTLHATIYSVHDNGEVLDKVRDHLAAAGLLVEAATVVKGVRA